MNRKKQPLYKRIIVKLFGKFYYFYVTNFRRDIMKKSLSLRRGECNHCGVCCKGCPNLLKNNDCKFWYRGNCDNQCLMFPVFPYQIEFNSEDVRNNCGYYWEEKDKSWLSKNKI